MEYFFKIFPFPTSSCPECNLDLVKECQSCPECKLDPVKDCQFRPGM